MLGFEDALVEDKREQRIGDASSGFKRRRSVMMLVKIAFCPGLRDGDTEGVRTTRSGEAVCVRPHGTAEFCCVHAGKSVGSLGNGLQISMPIGQTYKGSLSRTWFSLEDFVEGGLWGHLVGIKLSGNDIGEGGDAQFPCNMFAGVEASVLQMSER